jgi:branched-subunit amino acid aminotransferase/4-amino-4-deoxychorismate lyase
VLELDGHPATAGEVAALALRNYGHFTTMSAEGSAVRGLSLHLERLIHDCRIIHAAELDPDRVRYLVRRAVSALQQPVIIRVTVFDPGLELGHPGSEAEPHVLVAPRPAPTGAPAPVRLRSVGYQRDLPQVKHVGLFATIYHRRSAQLDGYDDVLFVDAAKQVIEGATWNVGFFDGTRILWPESDCLPGVTMRLLQGAIRSVESVSANLTLAQLQDMRAAFITNAGLGVGPVESIDMIKFPGDSAFIEKLQREYAAIPGEPL